MKNLQQTCYLIFFVLIVSLSFNLAEKGSNHYIDVRTSKALKELFHYNGASVPFLSSHRGGPENEMPENCIATFDTTLKYAYSIMEIDPRYTKDSIMIIHHDPTLNRTTNGSGRVIDFTLKELKGLRLKDQKGNVTTHQIPTFEEVLKWAKGKTVLVLDKKDLSIEARVKMVEKNKAESFCIVMAYSFDEAKICYGINKNIMMQIFVPNSEKAAEFEKTGVPWENVVAFVGHIKPKDPAIIKLIHNKGARCIMGTSRNLDRDFITGKVTSMNELKDEYNALTKDGVDILETDIPLQVSKVLDNLNTVDPSIKKYFN